MLIIWMIVKVPTVGLISFFFFYKSNYIFEFTQSYRSDIDLAEIDQD